MRRVEHPGTTAPDLLDAFEAQRSRLIGLGYRMLGSVADAEDVVQEAWLRWQAGDRADVANPEAYLTTITTRLALDQLRRRTAQREVYPGPWLPEPVALDDPAATVEQRESIGYAVLVLLEALSPLERAALVLHQVLGHSYAEVADILDRAEPAVRQLVSRARRHLAAGRPRFPADPDAHDALVRAFLACVDPGEPARLLGLLAPDVVITSDGGGVTRAPRRPVAGRDKVARLLYGIAAKADPRATYGFAMINGELGMVVRQDGAVVAALALASDGGLITQLYLVANPAKLIALNTGPSSPDPWGLSGGKR